MDPFNDVSTRMCCEYYFSIMALFCIPKEAHYSFRAIYLQLLWPCGWVVGFALGAQKSGAGQDQLVLCGVEWGQHDETRFI